MISLQREVEAKKEIGAVTSHLTTIMELGLVIIIQAVGLGVILTEVGVIQTEDGEMITVMITVMIDLMVVMIMIITIEELHIEYPLVLMMTNIKI